MSSEDVVVINDDRLRARAANVQTMAGEDAPVVRRHDGSGILERGTTIGRYVILDRLGGGGMGVVYAAYDPDLDRRVAVKLLHEPTRRHSRRHNQRLQREAQAMAQLNHPNVMAVYDVGTHDDHVFLAMELVQGCTLKQWRNRESRRWPEIVEIFVAAGRGLQAAHEAGLIHRDFKPDNVLVGDDGRVRVTDFGIARPPRSRASTRSLPPIDLPEGSSASGRVLDLNLTRPGALAGTPAYMAPEQFLGEPLDAYSDQFSFCVALWEALYGAQPFSGTSVPERASTVTEGRLEPYPAGVIVPGFVRRALERGLAVKPEDRYASMDALLTSLTRRPRARRLGAGFLGAAIAGVLVAAIALLRPDDSPCEGAHQLAEAVWGPEHRRRVEEAMHDTGVNYAADTWLRVQERLDRYTHAWAASHTDACIATHVHHTQSEAMLDRRVGCLDHRLARVRALVEVLGDADPRTVAQATRAVDRLPPVEDCAVPRVLERDSRPTDPEIATRLRELEERYLRVVALEQAGRYLPATGALPALLIDARELGHPPLLVDVLALRAALSFRTAPTEGEAAYREAYFEAVRHHRDDAAATLAIALIYVTGYAQARPEAALEWAAHAEAAIDRAGDPASLRPGLLKNLGNVHYRKGELELAQQKFEQALVQLEQLPQTGPARQHDELVLLSSLASIQLERGQAKAAATSLERALTLVEQVMGPRHPENARVYNELGNLAYQEGRLEQALEHYRTALELWTSALGELAPERVTVLTNLGKIHDTQGRVEPARTRYEQALALAEQVHGPGHPELALVLVNLGLFHEHTGEDEQARRRYARALPIREQALGPRHLAVSSVLVGLARAELRLGMVADARAHAERARSIRGAELGEDSQPVAEADLPLALALAEQGDTEAARVRLRRVLTRCDKGDCRPELRGQAGLALARLLDGPREQTERQARLEAARADLVRAGFSGQRAFEALEALESQDD